MAKLQVLEVILKWGVERFVESLKQDVLGMFAKGVFGPRVWREKRWIAPLTHHQFRRGNVIPEAGGVSHT
jgi:hypothetical protein